MSENNVDLFVPFKASIRNHLGELADKWMEAKIKLIQKLGDQIAGENDQAKLKSLRKELRLALVSKEDAKHIDATITEFLEIIRKNLVTYREIQRQWKDSTAK